MMKTYNHDSLPTTSFFPYRISILLFLSTLAFLSRPTDGYASWIRCHTELSDPEAVIMHSYIVPASQSRAPEVTLRAWKTLETGQEHSNQPSSHPTPTPTRIPLPSQIRDDGTHVVFFDTLGTTVLLTVDASKAPNHIRTRIQYVLDVLPSFTMDSVEKGSEDRTTSDDPQVVFLPPQDRKVVCKGKRSIGMSGNSVHTIQLNAPEVEVVAGWAIEHEAVTLTNKVRFVYQKRDMREGQEDEL